MTATSFRSWYLKRERQWIAQLEHLVGVELREGNFHEVDFAEALFIDCRIGVVGGGADLHGHVQMRDVRIVHTNSTLVGQGGVPIGDESLDDRRIGRSRRTPAPGSR